eukprot:3673394-Pleurochrysis_carterae.AAC.1
MSATPLNHKRTTMSNTNRGSQAACGAARHLRHRLVAEGFRRRGDVAAALAPEQRARDCRRICACRGKWVKALTCDGPRGEDTAVRRRCTVTRRRRHNGHISIRRRLQRRC